MPACEVEEVLSTFSSPDRDCSTGLVIRSRTCSEEEPGAVVITWICGRETEGISSWRIVVMMKAPMIDTAMQTSAMKDLLFRLRRARRFILLLGTRTGVGTTASSPRRSTGADALQAGAQGRMLRGNSLTRTCDGGPDDGRTPVAQWWGALLRPLLPW